MDEVRPVGVFLSSLAIPDPTEAIAKAAELGIHYVHIPRLPEQWLTPEGLDKIKAALEKHSVKVSAGCAVYPGEDYSNMETVRNTVGLLPAQYAEERLEITKQCADFTRELGAPILTTHVGVIPRDTTCEDYKRLVRIVQQVADDCAEKGLTFAMETGQETAEEMVVFLEHVARENVKINFDPANMILYGTGRPLPALDTLKEFVVHVHVKDGLWPAAEGELGTEVPLGQGEVGIPAYINKLKEIGYTYVLTIEREAGEDRIGDIARAKQLLDSLR